MRLLVLPGDGIGPEITAATLTVLRETADVYGLPLEFHEEAVGHASLNQFGTTVRPKLLELARSADGLILGPTATFDFRDPAKGEINPSAFFRKSLDLFANIRPSRTWPRLPQKLGAFDLIIARENTEGFYADRNMVRGNSEMQVTDDVVISLRRVTRKACTRIARVAFELAQQRRKHVTAVHKANVLKLGDGMFLDECRKMQQQFPEVALDELIVDAAMAHLIRHPQDFDVIVTTNMYGDIISDMTAEASGSLGLGGSLNAGDDYAMAQASHGSAPDIAGRNIANPFSLILSAAQLLDWLGRRKAEPACCNAAAAVGRGIENAIAAGEITRDIGGRLGTKETGEALARRIEHERHGG
jgi:3-isopropylmalate dehydrogenase